VAKSDLGKLIFTLYSNIIKNALKQIAQLCLVSIFFICDQMQIVQQLLARLSYVMNTYKKKYNN